MNPFDALNRSGLAMLSEAAPIETDALVAFWQDPEPFYAEQREMRAQASVAHAAAMTPLNAKQAARWADEEKIA
jgi:hypothetical protein